jgi:hypothetical protein
MAYQKLQVGTGIPVIPNDFIDIPAVSGPTINGTQTSTSTTGTDLTDTGQDFNSVVGIVGATVISNGGIAKVLVLLAWPVSEALRRLPLTTLSPVLLLFRTRFMLAPPTPAAFCMWAIRAS